MKVFDLHSHLMPGVDDGARSDEEARLALDRLAAAGVTAALTTPHFRGSLTHEPAACDARLAELDAGWSRLRAAADGRLELHRGVELLLDVPDPRPTDPRLRLGGGAFVLVEFPHMTVPPNADRPLQGLREQGFIPVLGHPERYQGVGDPVDAALQWRRAGAYLQVNGPSVLGGYGEPARLRALALLDAGLVDYVGSDFHARGEPMVQAYAAALSNAGRNDEQMELLMRTNPARLVEGLDPLPVPRLSLSRSLWSRLQDELRVRRGGRR